MSFFILFFIVALTACDSKEPISDKDVSNGEFDFVDYLVKNKFLFWEKDSMTFIYKGERYTSRYGIINEYRRSSFPFNFYPNCYLCGFLVFEKKELNTLYQSFCSSSFLIKIIDDKGVIKYYNEEAFGHNPEPEDGIFTFNIADSFIYGVFHYPEEYKNKSYSSRWSTNKEGIKILEDNEANEIYHRWLQTPCRFLVIHQDKSQTLVIPKICEDVQI